MESRNEDNDGCDEEDENDGEMMEMPKKENIRQQMIVIAIVMMRE